MLGTRYAGIVLSRRHDDIGAAMILEEYRGCLIDIGRIVERTVTYRMKVRNSDGDGEVIRLRNTAERVYGSVALKDQCEARDSMRFTGSCLQSGDRSEMWPCYMMMPALPPVTEYAGSTSFLAAVTTHNWSPALPRGGICRS